MISVISHWGVQSKSQGDATNLLEPLLCKVRGCWTENPKTFLIAVGNVDR